MNQEPLNNAALRKNSGQDYSDLPLKDFPEVDDFSIEFKQTESFGSHLIYTSKKFGEILSYPWLDHADEWVRKHFSLEVIDYPGVLEPFHELEQSWEAIIFSDEQYVYILESYEDPDPDLPYVEFPIWYKTKKETYISAWKKIIEQVKG